MANRYEFTSLWKTTLAEQKGNDNFKDARELLRTEFEKFRKKAEILASKISETLPNYTVHDITHLDALWEMADLVTRSSITFTPAEAFVLGGAFLIHDLGMGIASFPNGFEEIKKESIYKDAVSSIIKDKYHRKPTEHDLSYPDAEIEKKAVEYVLRTLHAKHAEKLAQISWKDKMGNQIFLLEHLDLRESYGKIIGLIAHSHWWPVSELEDKLPKKNLGSTGILPSDWEIDTLKLACVFRIADAIQIDDRRAPYFERVIRKPNEFSDLHWNFQQKLFQPRLEGNRIVYTSKVPFKINEAESWWTCFDVLKNIDSELVEVDSLLSDIKKLRLKAFGVAGIEDVSRLSKLIEVEGWQPVDTKITVSNVAKLVSNLGGSQLYGDDLSAPLRELIQNSSDAIRARRTQENAEDTFGEINVRFGEDANGSFIEVGDNGIGMSPKVLTGPFLDFGQSFWGTSLMHEELPGLESKGFLSTGEYGIGFFSVFMWGKKVSVITRRYDKGREDTIVLEFNKGVESRPILRKANSNEVIKEGGTRVRIWLSNPSIVDKLLSPKYPIKKERIEHRELIESLCPNIDCKVTLELEEKKSTIIEANDWLIIDPVDFIQRIIGRSYYNYVKEKGNLELLKVVENLSLIKENDGTIVGRALLFRGGYGSRGVITVGGLKACYIAGLVGVFIGTSKKAARDIAVPIISTEVMRKWVTNQVELLSDASLDNETQNSCAGIARRCGGNICDLKFAHHKNGMINYNELKNIILYINDDKIIIINDYMINRYERKNKRYIEFQDNVFWADSGSLGMIHNDYNSDIRWPEIQRKTNDYWFHSETLQGLIIEACSEVWGKSIDEILNSSEISEDEKKYKAVIGYVNGEPVELESVDIIHRPS